MGPAYAPISIKNFSGRGLVADPRYVAAVALAVLLATRIVMPISTTHVSCGALFGIGAVTRRAEWATTLPTGAALGAACRWAIGRS